MKHVYLIAATVEAPDETFSGALDMVMGTSSQAMAGDLDAYFEASPVTAVCTRVRVLGRVSADNSDAVDWLAPGNELP